MTLSIAIRNMRAGKGRVAFSIAGVAVATLLLSFILALYRGWSERIGSYIEETGASVWVSAYGSESFFTPGFISPSFAEQVREQPGVLGAFPLVYRPVKLQYGGGAWDTWVVGFDRDGIGGPAEMNSGQALPGPGEIVVDTVLARLSGTGVGDKVRVAGRTLTVSGISSGGNVVFAQLAFVDIAEARAQFGQALADARMIDIPASLQAANIITVLLVTTAPGEAVAVAAAINKDVPSVNAFTTAEFAENSRKPLRQSMLPVLLIILVLAFGVGTLVLGLTVYTAVLEKEREFGVIKAIGTPGPGLLRVVFEQALVSCLLGFAAGEALVFAAAWAASFAVPQMVTLIKPLDLLAVLGGAVAMSLLASVIPAGRIMRVNTLAVFKA